MFSLFRHMRTFCDLSLALIKWPLAILMFALIIPMIQSAVFYYNKVFDNWGELGLFGLGFGFMVGVWIFLIGRKNIVAATIEHEMTHAIFALLTFHNVTDLRAEMQGGGSMSFKGRGNWLITIAPYFFPTLSVGIIIVAVITYLITGQVVSWLNLALGLTTGYHFLAVLFELHPEQTDLKKAGWIFSFLFIPAANLLGYMLILAFVDRGLTGMVHFVKVLYITAADDIMRLINFM